MIRTAYNTSHYAGGSSSGSGAAVAAGSPIIRALNVLGFTPLALGADGGGSIRIPASNNGIVGLKATFGRIPETGASPLCWT